VDTGEENNGGGYDDGCCRVIFAIVDVAILLLFPIGPHNGGLLYTRLEDAEDETVGANVGVTAGGNANDEVLNDEGEFNGGPLLRFKI
jgi:hypothetical protein